VWPPRFSSWFAASPLFFQVVFRVLCGSCFRVGLPRFPFVACPVTNTNLNIGAHRTYTNQAENIWHGLGFSSSVCSHRVIQDNIARGGIPGIKENNEQLTVGQLD
jgi:hypothetical protein